MFYEDVTASDVTGTDVDPVSANLFEFPEPWDRTHQSCVRKILAVSLPYASDVA